MCAVSSCIPFPQITQPDSALPPFSSYVRHVPDRYHVRVGVKMARDRYFRPTPRPFRQRRPIRGNGKTFRIKSVHPSAGARQSNNWLKLILNHVCMDLEPSASRNHRTADQHSFPLCYWIHANTVSSARRMAEGCVFPDRRGRMTVLLRQIFVHLLFLCNCMCVTYKLCMQ